MFRVINSRKETSENIYQIEFISVIKVIMILIIHNNKTSNILLIQNRKKKKKKV